MTMPAKEIWKIQIGTLFYFQTTLLPSETIFLTCSSEISIFYFMRNLKATVKSAYKDQNPEDEVQH